MTEPLHKMVNGEAVALSPEEEAAVRAEWAANDAVPLPSPSWTPLDFMNRFTFQERIAIRQAASEMTEQGVLFADWLNMLWAAQTVHANHPAVIDGLQALVNANIISNERRNEILGVAT